MSEKRKKVGNDEKKAVLSFNKLSSLLSSRNYTLATVYCSGDGYIHFIETRTPKIQKTFIISIPSRYKMVATTESVHYKTVVITKIPGGVESRQLDYIAEVKGPLLECDLLSVSSTALCLCKNNTEIEIYKFGTIEHEEEEFIENLEDKDPVENLIKSAKKINKKMGGSDLEIEGVEKIEEEKEEEEKEEKEEEKEEEGGGEKEEEEEGGEKIIEGGEDDVEEVELEFRDENDNLVEEKANLDDEKVDISDLPLPENEKLKKEVEEVALKPKDERRRDNSMPEHIEDVDISLGIIYYSIEIGLFNKRISKESIPTFEDNVITIYDTIDDNESDIRDAKLDEVIEMAAKLSIKAKEEVENSKKEEMNLKTQILKLSAVLKHCEGLKDKITENPDKYTELKPEIERLHKQTKTTLYEINVEILRNKDKINEILTRYQTSLEELLDM
jgi:hypothetical protein